MFENAIVQLIQQYVKKNLQICQYELTEILKEVVLQLETVAVYRYLIRFEQWHQFQVTKIKCMQKWC